MQKFSEMTGSELEYWAAMAAGFKAVWDEQPESAVSIIVDGQFCKEFVTYNPYQNDKQFLELLEHGCWKIERKYNDDVECYVTEASYKSHHNGIKAKAISTNMKEACMRALCIAEYGEYLH